MTWWRALKFSGLINPLSEGADHLTELTAQIPVRQTEASNAPRNGLLLGPEAAVGQTGMPVEAFLTFVWDRWYKAAYYDPTPGAGGGDNYWSQATQGDTVPTVGTANATGDISNPGANVTNYANGADWNSQDGNVTTVGSAAANNYSGTADQTGNVWEWNDAAIGSSRGLRAR